VIFPPLQGILITVSQRDTSPARSPSPHVVASRSSISYHACSPTPSEPSWPPDRAVVVLLLRTLQWPAAGHLWRALHGLAPTCLFHSSPACALDRESLRSHPYRPGSSRSTRRACHGPPGLNGLLESMLGVRALHCPRMASFSLSSHASPKSSSSLKSWL